MKHELIIECLGDKNVKLKDENGKEISLPNNFLPEDSKKGEVLILSVNKKDEEEKNDQALAKKILNEILNQDG